MAKEKKSANRSDGSYITRKSGKFNILAFLLCILLAAFIWVYSENVASDDVSGEQIPDTTVTAQSV
jgi:hypothetical protein